MGIDRTLALAAFMVVTGCAAPREERIGEASCPIQGGVSDTRDLGVVGVALVDERGYVRRTCSGTLIAPNLALTAQHCVADTAPFVDCKSSLFGPLAVADRIRVTTSASLWSSDADWLPAVEVLAPPGPRRVCGRDVALLVLGSCVDGAHVRPLPPRLDALPEPQEAYAAIGFGASHGDGTDAGVRRRRDALHVLCVGGSCSSGQIDEDEWRGDHGICNGDSGGPAVDGRGFVIGVTSRGPKGCENPIYGGLSAHAEWLREVAKRAARDGAYGDPAWVGDDPDELRHAACGDAHPAAGCTAAGAGRGEGASLLLAGLALIAARRRRKA